MLSVEQKSFFIHKIIELRNTFSTHKKETLLEELEYFENKHTINELLDSFFLIDSVHFKTRLTEIFTQRWRRIRDSSLCYTRQPHNVVNQFCLELAILIAPPISTDAEIDALEPNTGPYFLLMPSLEQTETAFGENIHHFALHELVLSDFERVFIPIAHCLHNASISDTGQLRHMVMINDACPELSTSEQERVIKHSTQTEKLYESISALNLQRLLGNDLGAKLNQLVVALRQGGAHGGGSGREMNSGFEANVGISEFHHYWESLSEQQQLLIFNDTPSLKELIGRLFRPQDKDYQSTTFCVELIANALDPIVEKYNLTTAIQRLREIVQDHENALKVSFQQPQTIEFNLITSPPKHILPLIFKLNAEQQKQMFQTTGHANALLYALECQPDALFEFELSPKEQELVIHTRMQPYNTSSLINAVRRDKIKVVQLLVRWGADLNASDNRGWNALHKAAACGFVEIVSYLIESGAFLDAKTCDGSTALHLAARNGKKDVVELLLKKNLDINIRNIEGNNAFDEALDMDPELIECILMHLVTLPTEKQAECLLKAPRGPYPNALFYAAEHTPHLFDTLITLSLEQSARMSIKTLFSTKDIKGRTLLLCAAELGKEKSISKILDSNHLLDARTLLDAKTNDKSTALHLASRNGKKAVLELLLKKNMDINARNDEGNNALDDAIEEDHPELIECILMHLVTLPAEEQAECLLIAPEGPYPNALFYAADHQPHLFDKLVALSLERPGLKPTDMLFTNTTESGCNLLLLAVGLEKEKSISKLLDFGVDTEVQHEGDTALHFAARQGRFDLVNYLLAAGALLNAKAGDGSTALHLAARNGKKAVLALLLKKNVDINVRNDEGNNALDEAIKFHPELIESILMHLVTLPVERQAECLLKAPGGPYPNALFYAAVHKQYLFDDLITLSLEQPDLKPTDILFTNPDQNKPNLLLWAAELGNEKSVRKLHDFGLNIDSQGAGYTALHIAAEKGHVAVVNYLLKAGALLEAKASDGSTALHWATRNGKKAVLKLLLNKNADINVRNDKGDNALDIAIKSHPELVGCILMHLTTLPVEKQAQCLSKVPKGPYPNVLLYAADHKLHLFDALVTSSLKQPDLKPTDMLFTNPNQNKRTLLLRAAELGKKKCIGKLLDFGLDIDSQYEGRTALYLAASNGRVDIASYLLERGANLEVHAGPDKNTPLIWAVILENKALVRLLLKNNAHINAQNIQGVNAFKYAITKQTKLVELFLTHLTTLSASKQEEYLVKGFEDSEPNIIFYTAIVNPSLFDTLIARIFSCIDINVQNILLKGTNKKGETLLHRAAQLEKEKSIVTLLDLGMDIEALTTLGATALHWAAAKGHIPAINCLLERGATLEKRDSTEGSTALNIAAYCGKKDVVAMFLKKNAVINSRNKTGKNALDYAIAHYPELIEPILMHLVTLPIEEQAQSLLKVPGGPYNHVLFYAIARHPMLFNTLITTALREVNASTNQQFAITNNAGIDILKLALHRGEENSLKKLIHQNIRNANGNNLLDIAIAEHSAHIKLLLKHILTLPVEKQTKCLMNQGPYSNALFYAAPKDINLLCILLDSFDKDEIYSKMRPIYPSLHLLGLHYKKMKHKALKNSNYQTAASTAETLLKICTEELLKVFQSTDPINDKIQRFQNTCKKAIEEARPVLTKYREWAKVLASLLLAIITLPIALPLYVAGFFSPKTKSEQFINNLLDNTNKLTI